MTHSDYGDDRGVNPGLDPGDEIARRLLDELEDSFTDSLFLLTATNWTCMVHALAAHDEENTLPGRPTVCVHVLSEPGVERINTQARTIAGALGLALHLLSNEAEAASAHAAALEAVAVDAARLALDDREYAASDDGYVVPILRPEDATDDHHD